MYKTGTEFAGKGLYGVFEDSDSNDPRKIRQVLYGDGQERVKNLKTLDIICGLWRG
jgi:hypothetical protein